MSITSLLKSKFTANARVIAAVISVCIGAYGLTLLHWLEQTQQRAVELQPRESAPDFLITEARYLKFQPETGNETAKKLVGLERPASTTGQLKINIKSTTLAHYEKVKTSVFENPVVEFVDRTKENWLITANTANAVSTTPGQESISLEGNVTVTSLRADTISMTAEFLEIDPRMESISSETGVAMTFPKGTLNAGKLVSNLSSGQITLSDNVQAIYQPNTQPSTTTNNHK